MAVIKIHFANNGIYHSAMQNVTRAYANIPHTIIRGSTPETRLDVTILADSSAETDIRLLGKLELLTTKDSNYKVIPLNQWTPPTPPPKKNADERKGSAQTPEGPPSQYQERMGALGARVTSLESELARAKGEAVQWEKYATETEGRLTQDKEGAERKIRELVDALRTSKEAAGGSQSDYRTLLGEHTKLQGELRRTAAEESVLTARVRALEQTLASTRKDMLAMSQRYETARPIEDLILQWVESYQSRYETLAAIIQELGEVFDPALTVDELVTIEAQKHGLEFDAASSKIPDIPWEETEYHKTHGASYQDKKEEIALLAGHESAVQEGNPAESPITQLPIPNATKAILVDSLRQRNEATLSFVHEYEQTRSSYLTSLKEARISRSGIERLRKEITERRSQQERTLEMLATDVSDEQKAIPVFLIQTEQEILYTLKAVLPVRSNTRESLSDAFRYFHNLLTVITLTHEPKGPHWESQEHEELAAYTLSCPKSEWTRAKMIGLKETICDAMRRESQRYPLFKVGYRIQPVTFEIDDRMVVEGSEVKGLQTTWRQISPYLQDRIMEVLREHPEGLRQIQIQDILEKSPEVVARLQSLDCANIEPWRIHNAVTSLKKAGKIEKVKPPASEGKKFSIFKIPAISDARLDLEEPSASGDEEHSTR